MNEFQYIVTETLIYVEGLGVVSIPGVLPVMPVTWSTPFTAVAS